MTAIYACATCFPSSATFLALSSPLFLLFSSASLLTLSSFSLALCSPLSLFNRLISLRLSFSASSFRSFSSWNSHPLPSSPEDRERAQHALHNPCEHLVLSTFEQDGCAGTPGQEVVAGRGGAEVVGAVGSMGVADAGEGGEGLRRFEGSSSGPSVAPFARSASCDLEKAGANARMTNPSSASLFLFASPSTFFNSSSSFPCVGFVTLKYGWQCE